MRKGRDKTGKYAGGGEGSQLAQRVALGRDSGFGIRDSFEAGTGEGPARAHPLVKHRRAQQRGASVSAERTRF
jgi:hypothetical protein